MLPDVYKANRTKQINERVRDARTNRAFASLAKPERRIFDHSQFLASESGRIITAEASELELARTPWAIEIQTPKGVVKFTLVDVKFDREHDLTTWVYKCTDANKVVKNLLVWND